MAWNGGGVGNLSDIVDKGTYSSGSQIDLDDIVVSLPIDEINADIDAVEDLFVDAKDSLVHDFKEKESIAAERAQKLRHKINDLVAEELEEFFDEI